jgi:V/A-type H+-transporting ATPase subunit K
MSITLEAAIASIGAGLAIFGGAVGTGLAQSGIGSAGMGLLAEKPEEIGKVILFLVIPETLVIFGLVIAILIALSAGII